MAIHKRVMEVLMDTPEGEVEHQVTLYLADQMRGESEIKRRSKDTSYAINLGAAMCWSAMRREGLTELDLEEFAAVCLAVGQVDEDEDQIVDPTPPAASSESV